MVIKDTVRLAPSSMLLKDTLNGEPVNTNRIPQKLSKAAAMIMLQQGGRIAVTVIGGRSAAKDDLVMRSPYQITLVKDAPNQIGFQWVSPEVFPPGTVIDIGLYVNWQSSLGVYQGPEKGSQITQENESTYIIYFEDIGYPPYYEDVIVLVVIFSDPDYVYIKKFLQGDPLWGSIQYDMYIKTTDKKGNKIYWTLAAKGCSLTCMAMIAYAGGANIDPGKLAEYMNNPNHYWFSKKHGVVWGAINNFSGNSKFLVDTKSGIIGKGLIFDDNGKIDWGKTTQIDITKMDAELSNGSLIIAQVYNPSSGGNHWVLVTEKQNGIYKIIDPGGYRERESLNAYNNVIYKFVVYKKK